MNRQQLEELLSTGDYENARIVCESLLTSEAQDGSLWLSMAKIQLKTHHYDEALRCCQTAASLQPDLTEAVYYAALAYSARGNTADAFRAFNHVITSDPGHFPARIHLAAAFAERGHHLQSKKHYLIALELQPDNTTVLCNLGRELHFLGEYAEALSLYRKAIRLNPGIEMTHLNMAFTLQAMGNYTEALACYRKARTLNPRSASAASGEADILHRTNRTKSATPLVTELIKQHPEHIPSITLYASMARSHGNHKGALMLVETALSKQSISRQDRIQLEFAAGSLYDATHEYAKAFSHFRNGNQLVKTRYSAAAHHENTDRTIRFFSKRKLENFQVSRCETRKPIFILGMPRSGTSLVEQILASHRQIFAAGETQTIHRLAQSLSTRFTDRQYLYPDYLDFIDNEGITAESKRYLEELSSLSPNAARIIDKTPHNFLYLPLIWMMFPQASIIHCRRHPLDTCLSIYFRLFSGGNEYSYDIDDLGQHYADYIRLMQHWDQLPGIRILDICYENVVTDQEYWTRQILDHCGLDWDTRCLSFHETKRTIPSASFDQVNKPMYRNSVYRWKNYREELDQLSSTLAPVIDAYERIIDSR